MEHIVTVEEEGLLLRQILRGPMGVSWTAMKSAKWDDRILLDGSPCPVDRRVERGQTVAFLPKEQMPVYEVRPYDLPLTVPYRDEHMLIIDKPAPLASQSSLGHPDDSLENAVFALLGCPEGFIYRPVNRLDKGTSGLMAVALDAHSQHRLQEQLHTPDFRRRYLAVTEGIPSVERGTVDAPIAKVEAASVKRQIRPDGKPSVTHYQVLATGNGRALIELELETGRTHQIRVHLASIGCPVAGDFLYGQELPELPGRFALHSHSLSLLHPFTGERLELTSPAPAVFTELLGGARP